MAKKKKKSKWLDLSAFDDGYDFGDITKTITKSAKKTSKTLQDNAEKAAKNKTNSKKNYSTSNSSTKKRTRLNTQYGYQSTKKEEKKVEKPAEKKRKTTYSNPSTKKRSEVIPNRMNTQIGLKQEKKADEEFLNFLDKKTTTQSTKRTWFDKGALDDGYDIGDITKTVLGTGADLLEHASAGIMGMGETAVDTLAYLAPAFNASQTVQNGGSFDIKTYRQQQEWSKDFMKKDLYDENKIAKNIITKPLQKIGIDAENNSLLGEKFDALAQSAGQLGATIGLQALGIPWWLTTGATSFGAEAENALNEGASYGAAGGSALISAGAEVFTEKLSGGIKFGGKALDDKVIKGLGKAVTNKTARTLAKLGIDATGEGGEEVLTSVISRLGTALYKEESLEELLTSEEAMDEYIESFIGGAVLGGTISGVSAVKSNKSGRDYVTGLTEGEQKVIDREVEDRVSERIESEIAKRKKAKVDEAIKAEIEKKSEKFTLSNEQIEGIKADIRNGFDFSDMNFDDVKITKRERNKIEDQVRQALERGEIDTFKIEDTLYRDNALRMRELSREKETATPERQAEIDAEMNALTEEFNKSLKKNGLLQESYRQEALKKEKLDYKLEKNASEKAKKIVQSAVESGADNTRKMHEKIDFVIKMAENSNLDIAFTNDAELEQLGHYKDVEGLQQQLREAQNEAERDEIRKSIEDIKSQRTGVINGLADKDTRKILLNLDSKKLIEFTSGHEVTHFTEEMGSYDNLKAILKEYAVSKGEYQRRLDEAYINYYGQIKGKSKAEQEAFIEQEVTADLVGEYIFNDQEFISNLSAREPNIFMKAYDYVKHLYKMATAGSDEARKLEQAKRMFDKAYKEMNKGVVKESKSNSLVEADSNTRFSLVEDQKTIDFLENQDYIVTYKSMQLIDGKLYPPMSAEDKGTDGKKKLRPSSVLGRWQQADENPSNIKKFAKEGYGKYVLHKGNKKSIEAAYNPYEHSSNLVLNDQFEEAYQRPNLVTVECHIPVSEMTSGYKAQYAKDPTGMHDWKAGVVANKIKDNKRKVYLTRWLKPVRVLDDAEVAQKYKEILGDEVSVPFNVVSPSLLAELEKVGVKIDHEGSPMYKAIQKRKQAKAETKYSISDTNGRELTKAQQEYFKNSKARDDEGRLVPVYHTTSQGGFTVFDPSKSDDKRSFFFTNNFDMSQTYAREAHHPILKKSAKGPRGIDLETLRKLSKDYTLDFGARNEDGYYLYSSIDEFIEGFNQDKNGVLDEVETVTIIKDDEEFAYPIKKDAKTVEEALGNLLENYSEEFDSLDVDDTRNGKGYYEVYLNLEDPLIIDGRGRNWNDINPFADEDGDISWKVNRFAEIAKQYVDSETDYNTTIESLGDLTGGVDFWLEEQIENGEDPMDLEVEKALRELAAEIDKAYAEWDGDAHLDEDGEPMSMEDYLYENTPVSMTTRQLAEHAYDNGYDGVIIKDIQDTGKHSASYYHGDVYIAFDSNQIKSVANENPTSDPDIRYSVTDNLGNELSPAVQKRFANSKVRDEDGDLKVVYHGTASGEFYIFDRAKGNAEGDFGRGFYFSDDEGDMETNYEGGGPDLEVKIARRAEQIEYEEGIYEDEADARARAELVKGANRFEVYLNMENPAVVGETILLDQEIFMEQYNPEDFDSEDDYYAEVEQFVADEIDKIAWEVDRNLNIDDVDELKQILFEAYYEGGIGVEDLKERIGELAFLSEEGDYIGNEITRQVIESLGYDGIIDPTVSTKFRNMNMTPGTTHYIVFKPNQIKNITNENPTDNPDIRYSLSDSEGKKLTKEQQKFFKDSKVRDEDGNLRVVYHGSYEDFTIFDRTKSRANMDIQGNFFSPWDLDAQGYGPNVRAFYLNITNPAPEGIAYKALNKFKGQNGAGIKAREYLESLGYDGVNNGDEEYIAFYPHQIKSIDNENPTADPDIRYSYSDDDIAPVRFDEGKALTEVDLPYIEQQGREAFRHITEDYDYEDDGQPIDLPLAEVDDPLKDRNIEDVGNRKVKAYMYENPEVKPFFQREAEVMLTDLRNSIKGQKFYNDDLYYRSSGEEGFFGTKRHTSEDIAYLLDNFHYTYADIEKGLNDIIEDNGAENNAVSKRIEFLLDERLREGYNDFMYGDYIEPNADYVNLLREKQITQYNDEAFEQWVRSIAPEDIPVEQVSQGNVIEKKVAESKPIEDIAPVKPNKDAEFFKTATQENIDSFMEAKSKSSSKREPIYKEVSPTKKKRNGLDSAWDTFQTQFVNRNRQQDKLAKQANRPEIKFKGDRVNNIAAEIGGDIFKAQTDNYGNAIGKALHSHFEPILEKGNGVYFNDYLMHLSNIERHAQGKGSKVPTQTSRDYVQAYETRFPEFKEAADGVHKYNQNQLNNAVENGLYGKDFVDHLVNMYGKYVPFYSAETEAPNIDMSPDEIRSGRPIKRAIGGAGTTLQSVEQAMIKQTYSYMNAIAKNDLYKEIVQAYGGGGSKTIDTREGDSIKLEDFLYEDETGKYLTAFFNGEARSVQISEELFAELKRDLDTQIKDIEEKYGIITKPLQKLSQLRGQLLTTYNPSFIVTNPIKDIQDALLNSKHTMRYIKNLPSAFVDSVKGKDADEYARLFKKHTGQDIHTVTNVKALDGTALGYYKDWKRGSTWNKFMTMYGNNATSMEYSDDTSININKSAKKAKNKGFLNKLGNANNFVEVAFRYPEFKATLEKGKSVTEALYNAREVTTNFGRGGTISKAINRNGATFFNTSVQGMDKFFRNFSMENGAKGFMSTVAKSVILGMTPAMINHILLGGGYDDEYEALPEYVKSNYYLFKKGDGEFYRIPKGRMMSVIGSAARLNLESAIGKVDPTIAKEVDNEEFLRNAMSQVGASNPLKENIFAPLIQAHNNEAWYGGDLVPSRLQKLPVAEQYDATTDEFSKWLGEKLDVSPYKVNYVLDQYSGGIGDIMLPYITPEATSGAEGAELAIAPIKDKFVVNSTDDNKYVGELFDLSDKLKVQTNSSEATLDDVLQYEYISDIASQMGELYALKREIQADETLSKSEKYAEVQKVQDLINDLATEGVQNYNSGKSLDLAYEMTPDAVVSKVYDDYQTYDTYRKGMWDFKADKDENGKTIVGSKQEKIIDYLNETDLDYGERIILFRQQYPTNDTYNEDIIDYLNSRDDLYYEDVVIILESLGFTVKDDGTVEW